MLSVMHYEIEELLTCCGAIVIPTITGHWGLLLYHFGNPVYHENIIGVVWNTTMLPGIRAGAGVRRCTLAIQNYGSDSSVAMDIGCMITPCRALRLGASVMNITRESLGRCEERITPCFRAGLSIHLPSGLIMATEIEKEKDMIPLLKSGLEFQYARPLFLRFGYIAGPDCWTTGFGIRFFAVHMDYALEIHPVLGMTHCLGLLIRPFSSVTKHGA